MNARVVRTISAFWDLKSGRRRVRDTINLFLEASVCGLFLLFAGFLAWGARRRSPALYSLAAISASIGAMMGANLFGAHAISGLRNDLNLVLELILGPLLYLYTTQALPAAPRLTARSAVHLAPAVLGFAYWKSGAGAMDIIVVAIFAGYLALAWRVFLSRLPSGPLRGALAGLLSLFTALLVFRAAVSAGAAAGAAPFEDSGAYTLLLSTLFAASAFVMVTALRYPDLLSAPNAYFKYGSSSADPQTLSAVKAQIAALIATEKPFLTPDLTLAAFSEKLGAPPRLVSQVINSEFGVNFPTLMNDIRVKDAAARLLSDRDTPVKTIMYECGFRSKSAFNREFRRVHGVSPSDYKSRDAPKGREPAAD